MSTFASTSDDLTARSERDGPLRLVLRANAGFSAASGLVAVLAAGPVADLLAIDTPWLVRLVGAGLLGFAAAVFLISRAGPRRLARDTVAVSVSDFAWVVATGAIVALGWLSGTGAIVMGLIAVVVAAFGVEQLWFRARLTAPR